MNSLDSVRFIMQRVAAKKEIAKQQSRNRQTKEHTPRVDQFSDEQMYLSLETKFISNFHAANPVTSLINIARYVAAEIPVHHTISLLRVLKGNLLFRQYFKPNTYAENEKTFEMEHFACVRDVVEAKVPVIHKDETGKGLGFLCQWKVILGYIPDMVAGIPIICPREGKDGKEDAVVGVLAISFKHKLPKGFWEKQLPAVKEVLAVIGPYAMINQSTYDHEDSCKDYTSVLESLEKVEKVIQHNTPELALTQIGAEIGVLGNCRSLAVFIVDEGDHLLRKYYTNFGHPGRSNCPNKKIHGMQDLPMHHELAAHLNYVAKSKRGGLRINNMADYTEYGISAKNIHSIGSCVTRNLLVVPVIDYSGESPLVVELADKEKGFSLKELETVLLFCRHTACLLTCVVLLDRRERNFRRRNIINEMLCSISFIKENTVEQFITQHRKTSLVFRGSFDEWNLCIRCFPEQDIAGIALEIFYELDIVKDFKIRRSVLVRFIISVQQGYGPLPYHNWYHAVSVAHYAYLLIRKMKLIENGHLNKLEAFALVVSALTHDIDHRGTNNQFQSYTNSDIYKLYACEDSVMERHHLSIALAILHREDCNILESFNDTDYKYFVELLTWNIIATDITKHMKTRDKLFAESKSNNPKARKMSRLSLFMTAADLCDNCKKWDDNLLTAKGILQEFFNQGDMERQLGFQPIPMMDRHVAYIPMIEYKFVKFIVTPVYKHLAELYEEMKPCVENIRKCEDLWVLATVVFDARKNWDQLDILDLPEMKEDQLMKIKLEEPLDTVKHRKFSLPTPAPAPSTVSATATTSSPTLAEKKSIPLPLPLEEDLAEVDTGEKRNRNCCACFCCKCCRKNKNPEIIS